MKILLDTVYLFLLAVLSSSTPVPAQHSDTSLHKRYNPVFAAGWTAEQIIQITQGFNDACVLAKAAREAVRKPLSGTAHFTDVCRSNPAPGFSITTFQTRLQKP